MELIKKLQEQEKDLMRLLEEIREQIRQERTRYTFEKYGVKTGSIIRDNFGDIFRVTGIDDEFIFADSRPWLKANRQKINGEFSSYKQTVLYWELVE